MMTKSRVFAYKLISVLFVILIFAGFIRGTYDDIHAAKGSSEDGLSMTQIIGRKAVKENFSTGPWNENDLINLNGTLAKAIGMQSYYNDIGINVADNKYIVALYPETTTDYEFEQVMSFKKFCDESGIKLLYVNKPTKYLTDDEITQQFGKETYSNRNADRLINRLREGGVSVVDIRDYIEQDGKSSWELFYRTDHHWTTRATLWAVKKIADGLNMYCGYNIDTSIYDEDNYTMIDYPDSWLGEQGKKIAESYIGLDDYTKIVPKFKTSYTFKSEKGDYDGTFEDFIDEKRLNPNVDVYESKSWHYAYRTIDCVNHNVDDGKVLILGDSFEQTTAPFLSLCLHETDTMVRRQYKKSFDLRQHILDEGYDTVIICYAQLMIGAHDDPDSANYKMYSFSN